MKKIKYVLFTFILCFISLNTVYADATCVYEVNAGSAVFNANFNIICEANNNVKCSTSTTNVKISKSSLTINDFKKDNIFSCPKGLDIDVNVANTIEGSPLTITDVKVNNNNSNYILNSKKSVVTNDTNSSIEDNIENEQGGLNDNNNETNTNNTWTPKSFCQKESVKGTFRVVGWVIFIIKILIPIILIVFGSIDLAKAVLASKDDEIKKSMKTLVVRVIAGIIIFFIPTFLNFVIKLIGGENIYNEKNGSFGFCTHCMLEPTDDACGNLLGGK